MSGPKRPTKPKPKLTDDELFRDFPCARCGGSWDEHGRRFGGPCRARDCYGYTDDGEHWEA